MIHDSLHARKGWTAASARGRRRRCGVWLDCGRRTLKGSRRCSSLVDRNTLAHVRTHRWVSEACGATRIETQTNEPLLTVMLHTFAQDVTSERVSSVRNRRRPTRQTGPFPARRRTMPHGLFQAEKAGRRLGSGGRGQDCGNGGMLFHYNRPYGDIYMEVSEAFRRRGLGCYLVQELKRVCYEQGSVPAARCNPANIASRRTLQKAGFVPCGHILTGSVSLSSSTY